MSIVSLVYRVFKTRSVPLGLLNRVKLKDVQQRNGRLVHSGAASAGGPLADMSIAMPSDVIEHEEVPSDAQEMPRMVDMRNGQKVPLIFSEIEMIRRLARLRQYMADNGIGATVLTSMHNVNYYSGFLYTSFGRPYGVAITLDKCITLSAGIDGGQPWRHSFGHNYTYTDWQKGNFYHAIQKALGKVNGKVGLEFDTLSLDCFKQFQEILPNNPKVDIARPTMRMRMIKSPEEIQVIRNGARIGDLGGAACVEALHEGIPEYQVALAASEAMVNEIARTYPHSELRDTWTWFQSGLNTDGAHNPVTTRRVKQGDILSLNCFPMISGYYTALERTLFLGHALPEYERIWNINCEVHRRGLELIRPGARCCDIAAELNDIYRQYDLLQFRSFGYGHSFGTLCHYYGREADLELREDVTTVLQPGMVVSMEPMVMIPEGRPGAGGYREHDILIVKKDGAENITKFPFGPEHNIIKK